MCSLCLNKSSSSEHIGTDGTFPCLDHQNSSNIFKGNTGINSHPSNMHFLLSLWEEWNDKTITKWAWVIIESKIMTFNFECHSVFSNTYIFLWLGIGGIHFLIAFVNTEVTIKIRLHTLQEESNCEGFSHSTLSRNTVKYILFCHSVKTDLTLRPVLWVLRIML